MKKLLLISFILLPSILSGVCLQAAEDFTAEIKYPEEVRAGKPFQIIINVKNDASNLDMQRFTVTIEERFSDDTVLLEIKPQYSSKYIIPISKNLLITFPSEFLIKPTESKQISLKIKAKEPGRVKGWLKIKAYGNLLNHFKEKEFKIEITVSE